MSKQVTCISTRMAAYLLCSMSCLFLNESHNFQVQLRQQMLWKWFLRVVQAWENLWFLSLSVWFQSSEIWIFVEIWPSWSNMLRCQWIVCYSLVSCQNPINSESFPSIFSFDWILEKPSISEWTIYTSILT